MSLPALKEQAPPQPQVASSNGGTGTAPAPTGTIRAIRRSPSCGSRSPWPRSPSALDKFFNVMVDWPVYLAPWINDVARARASSSCTSWA